MSKRSKHHDDATPDLFADLGEKPAGSHQAADEGAEPEPPQAEPEPHQATQGNAQAALHDTQALFALLDRWVERGWLRALDRALASFFQREVNDAPPLLLLAAALASHQLGRGHVCLDLAQTLAAPDLALSLPPEGDDLSDPPPLPSDLMAELDLATWHAALHHPALVADGNEPPGNTPLVRLQRLGQDSGNLILAKLEGNNPAGSVKDRPALSMIQQAEARGEIKPGDTLIEATSGNTGIALAMAAAIKGYRLVLIMPDNMSAERRASMAAYGAELILVSKEQSMEGARDLAQSMAAAGEGKVLDQFGNADNPLAHYQGTGPEIWRDTQGTVTHFVSAMGTTGTIMGTSRFLKEQNPAIKIVGLQPQEGSSIPGIRRWPKAYMPTIFDAQRVDEVIDIKQQDAEVTMRDLAAKEGIFCGVSSGGAIAGALQLSARVENAVIVAIICDRGDRYLSTGVFDVPAP